MLAMDPISAAIGGGMSLIGGLMNSASQSSANAANLAFAKQQATGQFLPEQYANMVSGANAAGLNPLAVLGVSSSAGGGPVQVGTSPGAGLESAGKIMSDMKVPDAKLDNLKERLVQAQIDNTNADTTGTMLRNSHLAVSTQPGIRPGSDPAHAIPAFSWYTDDKGKPFLGQSHEFAGSQFGPGSIAPGIIAGAKEIGENAVQMGSQVWSDVKGWGQSISPAVTRFFGNQ